MIIVRLKGGLGNQLFQYATARHLAHLNNSELFLDTSYFEFKADRPAWKYELGAFNIKAEIAEEQLLKDFHAGKYSGTEKLISKIVPFHKYKKYKYEGFGYNEQVLELKGNYYLSGYFQSHKYFKPITDILKEELTLKEEYIPKANEWLDDMKNKLSVAVHIRRCDYIRNLSSMEAHGLCSKDYYAKTIEFVKRELGEEVHFFLFTDDAEWVKREMEWDINSTMVQGKSILSDFYMMSNCKHNIIANSTFSWWAAWLNPNPDKMIIVPKHWDNNIKTEEIDLCPTKWIIK